MNHHMSAHGNRVGKCILALLDLRLESQSYAPCHILLLYDLDIMCSQKYSVHLVYTRHRLYFLHSLYLHRMWLMKSVQNNNECIQFDIKFVHKNYIANNVKLWTFELVRCFFRLFTYLVVRALDIAKVHMAHLVSYDNNFFRKYIFRLRSVHIYMTSLHHSDSNMYICCKEFVHNLCIQRCHHKWHCYMRSLQHLNIENNHRIKIKYK